MKILYSLFLLAGLSLIVGCQNSQGNKMVLLDEKVKEVNLSYRVMQELIPIELLELYYKKYTNSVKVSNYIEWANDQLYMDVLEINKLASAWWKHCINAIRIQYANSLDIKQRTRGLILVE